MIPQPQLRFIRNDCDLLSRTANDVNELLASGVFITPPGDVFDAFGETYNTARIPDQVFPHTDWVKPAHPPEAWQNESIVQEVDYKYGVENLLDPHIIANSHGYGRTSWHLDQPAAPTFAQLQSGEKVWWIASTRRDSQALVRRDWSIKEWAEDQRAGRWSSVKWVMQRPGEVVFLPTNIAHMVLSGRGMVTLLTWQLAERNAIAQRNAIVREGITPTGERHVGRGMLVGRKRKTTSSVSRKVRKR